MRAKTTEELEADMADPDNYHVMTIHNLPARAQARHYLMLQAYKDDPDYRDRTLYAGDTVLEGYEAYTRYWTIGLKQTALHAFSQEYGSTHYEYKTYKGILNAPLALTESD